MSHCLCLSKARLIKKSSAFTTLAAFHAHNLVKINTAKSHLGTSKRTPHRHTNYVLVILKSSSSFFPAGYFRLFKFLGVRVLISSKAARMRNKFARNDPAQVAVNLSTLFGNVYAHKKKFVDVKHLSRLLLL